MAIVSLLTITWRVAAVQAAGRAALCEFLQANHVPLAVGSAQLARTGRDQARFRTIGHPIAITNLYKPTIWGWLHPFIAILRRVS